MGHADGLSRLIARSTSDTEDIVVSSVEAEVCQVFQDACRALPVTAQMVKEASTNDPLIKKVKQAMLKGWKAGNTTSEFYQFYLRRDSLSIYDDCLMFSERLVIPASLQQRVLKQFHVGHPGRSRMKSIVRSYVYWPFIDKHVEDYVARCSRCASAAKNPPKSESLTWPPTKSPWSRIHLDFAGPLDSRYFLVLIDSHSKWPEICVMKNPTTTATISFLRDIFSRFGVPETLVTDNGTQFTSFEFADFCRVNGIQHIRTPPYHPQSNGQVERFVDTLKRALLKAQGEGNNEEILNAFLKTYRCTPHMILENKSPAEVMFGRKIRTSWDLIKPCKKNTQPTSHTQVQRIRKFEVGDLVYARDYRHSQNKWQPGQVSGKRGEVIYEVKTGKDVWIRHANQLRMRAGSRQREDDNLKQLPLEILCETFGIPSLTKSINENESTSSECRRSVRVRRPVKPFQIQPKAKSYVRSLRREVL